jgi:hypothetical protein
MSKLVEMLFNLGTINNLSEKFIELYEKRLEVKDIKISDLKVENICLKEKLKELLVR